MKLPGAERAVVDMAKLRGYCLNPSHPRGRHKARVFAAALGLTAADADLLREALLIAALHHKATLGERDDYGQRYVLDFQMKGPAGRGHCAEPLDCTCPRRFSALDELPPPLR